MYGGILKIMQFSLLGLGLFSDLVLQNVEIRPESLQELLPKDTPIILSDGYVKVWKELRMPLSWRSIALNDFIYAGTAHSCALVEYFLFSNYDQFESCSLRNVFGVFLCTEI